MDKSDHDLRRSAGIIADYDPRAMQPDESAGSPAKTGFAALGKPVSPTVALGS